MAAFTSAQTGNWNDGATWGNTSPGTKGTDWPGLAGDTATVANTHTVTYNVSETNQLGAVTINSGGTLTFSPTMDTLLTIATGVDFTISSGATLTIGSSITPIDKAYTAQINHASAATSYGFTAIDGCTIDIYGDPDFYGNTFYADIAVNWTTGQTFTVSGDLTALWQAGNTLFVIKDGEYSLSSTDANYVTIASVAANGGNTDITINEAFPGGTYSIGSRIYNVGRNVIISQNGSLTYGNSTDNSSGTMYLRSSAGTINVSSAILTNGYNFYTGGVNFTNCCLIGWYSGSLSYLGIPDYHTNTFISYFSVNTTTLEGWYGDLVVYNLSSVYFSSCSLNFTAIGWSVLERIFFSNLNIRMYKYRNASNAPLKFLYFSASNVSLQMGKNENDLTYSSGEIFNDPSSSLYKYNDVYFQTLTTVPTDYSVLFYGENSSTDNYSIQIFINDMNGSGPRSLSTWGELTYETADGSGSLPNQRSGGNTEVWQAVTSSNITIKKALKVPLEFNYYTTASSTKTFRIYFQTDYTSEAKYIAYFFHPDIGPLSVTGTITTRASASDWTQYAEFASQNFTTAAWVKISVFIWGYESGKYIWIDPLITVS